MFANGVRKQALSLFVVWSLTLSLLATIGLFAVPAAAQPCDNPAGGGDWTVSTAQVCDGVIITMDGNLSVTATGSLTVRNGGIKFVQDTSHVWSISVSGGGDLILENSKVWTETTTINPYLKLAVSVAGAGSLLRATDSKFALPGWINTSASATVWLDRSVITRTEADVTTIFTTVAGQDDNDDSPGLTFLDSTVSLFASRIEALYEHVNLIAQDNRQVIRIQGSTVFTAVDTFIAIDFNPSVTVHNSFAVSGTARAYLYGVYVDSAQNPPKQDQWSTGVTAAGTAVAYLYRFANVRVVDANDVPVPGADVDAEFAGPESGPAYFPDNANLNYPPANMLAYLGKDQNTWDDTGANGNARMPLLSDWIDVATMPNSRFVGTFSLLGTSGADTGTSSLTFSAYPAMDLENASASAIVKISTLVQPLPDLLPVPPLFNPATPKEGQDVLITANVANQGQGGAVDVLVRVFDGVTLLHESTIPFIGPGGQESVSTTLVNATAGQHVIRVSADPNNVIIEGAAGSPAESNNIKGYQLSVTPLGPDFVTDVSFDPDPGFLNNPVQLVAGVTNIGDRNATNIVVTFYQQESQPDALSVAFASATIPSIGIGGAATVSVNWTPTSLGSFRIWAWADPGNAIPEPAPYSETNNLGSNLLSIAPAPDLLTLSQDLTLTDPFPRVGVPVTIETIVRNNGQAIASAPFRADLFVDGVSVGTQTRGTDLAPGERWSFTVPAPSFATCGSHSIGISVDAANQVQEGSLYELNNRVTTAVQVYPSQVLTWSNGAIDADQAVSSSIEITGSVTITGARLQVVQDQDPCGRYYVKVLGGGSLTLVDATLSSNWPLVIFVADGGSLTAINSTFNLDVQGKGVLYSRGTSTVRTSQILGDVVARGQWADFRNVAFSGAQLHVNAAETSRIWDSTFPGVVTLQLASDAAGQAVPDFDIRNVTFNAQLTSQLVFSGDQWVQLTSVGLTKAGDWWAGMLAQNARVSRYFWIDLRAVDGTGTLIQDPTTSVSLERFDPATLTWNPAPTCSADDCYQTVSTTWPALVPTGQLLYRAPAEERYGAAPPTVQATYRASGSAFIEGQIRNPDSPVTALVTTDTTVTLVFSELTPDLSIFAIAFYGDNGIGVDFQPMNRELTIVATVNNSGAIITRGVIVHFYFVDIDTNRDGIMDQPHEFYASSGQFIGSAGPIDVPAQGSVNFARTWTPQGGLEASVPVSAVVDPSFEADLSFSGAIAELNETNNVRTRTLVAFVWPDLHFASDPIVSIDPVTPIVNNVARIELQVTNEGTNTAFDAIFGVYSLANVSLGPSVLATIPRGGATRVTVTWIPLAAGSQTIRVRVTAAGGPSPDNFRNWDFDLTDNYADRTLSVITQPELTVAASGAPPSPFRNQAFNLNLTLTNTGQTTATGIVVAVADEANPSVILGATYGIDVPPGTVNVTVRISGIATLGGHVLLAAVDFNNTVNETDELNNVVQITVTVQAPSGRIVLSTPTQGQSFRPGVTISVAGAVRQTDNTPIGDVNVTATLVDAAGNTVGLPKSQLSSRNDGRFLISLDIPANLAEGTYRLRVSAPDPSVDLAEVQVRVAVPLPWWAAPFLGLPVWLWLIVIIGAAAAIGGGTAYVKFVGLGKLVECGECGAFIPEDSAKCPKCGVEFEKDMAKCSNCQAWIPIDVKQCPECGVEFATGEVEMADYEAEMKRQYEEVKRRFREEASRELGRALSEKEFEDWWRQQPTFVTFEDWLREEEEMRRMGSKPCPVCNTLNSVTATVCHKCGTLLKEPPSTGRGGAPPPAARPRTPTSPPPPGEGPEGTEAMDLPTEPITRKVVKKPIVGPVVQKKVIKRPLEEEKKEGEEGTEDEGEQL
ncbi:MAG: hypothetical protein HY557_04980 [Euryarchaeota archaeon]|nr:hypothetical protein [Euryarchaeota archaeon]